MNEHENNVRIAAHWTPSLNGHVPLASETHAKRKPKRTKQKQYAPSRGNAQRTAPKVGIINGKNAQGRMTANMPKKSKGTGTKTVATIVKSQTNVFDGIGSEQPCRAVRSMRAGSHGTLNCGICSSNCVDRPKGPL